MFLSKVYCESSEIVEQMLKRNSNANDDGETGIPHVSYLPKSDRMEEHIENIKEITAMRLKKKVNSYKGRQRLKSWTEKVSSQKTKTKKQQQQSQVYAYAFFLHNRHSKY